MLTSPRQAAEHAMLPTSIGSGLKTAAASGVRSAVAQSNDDDRHFLYQTHAQSQMEINVVTCLPWASGITDKALSNPKCRRRAPRTYADLEVTAGEACEPESKVTRTRRTAPGTKRPTRPRIGSRSSALRTTTGSLSTRVPQPPRQPGGFRALR
jgi:hypothetical protein